jgi:hypothetical protein
MLAQSYQQQGLVRLRGFSSLHEQTAPNGRGLAPKGRKIAVVVLVEIRSYGHCKDVIFCIYEGRSTKCEKVTRVVEKK